jgi:alanyl-tRNA synthetase
MRLDWNHRYLNMQQHTGQHILSACFKKFHNLNTLSVHLGSDITMIELDTPAVITRILEETELSANQLIRDDLNVESITVDRHNLEEYNIRRRIKTQDDQIRLVKIGDMDCVGCGGTHVRSTAEVGLIKITGMEKIRGHARIKIKIGATAYHYFNELHHTLQKVSSHLTTSVEELSDRIGSLIAEKKELINEKKRITELWLSEYAGNLVGEANTGCFALKKISNDQLKILSEQYLMKYQVPCLFVSEEAENMYFYIRFPSQLDKNAQDFIQKYKSTYFLKGGGSKDFAVGQIAAKNRNSFSMEHFFRSFNEFVNERSDN